MSRLIVWMSGLIILNFDLYVRVHAVKYLLMLGLTNKIEEKQGTTDVLCALEIQCSFDDRDSSIDNKNKHACACESA